MAVRGAPALAIVGMLSLAVELQKETQLASQSCVNVKAAIESRLQHLVKARPTAVNLQRAATIVQAAIDAEKTSAAVIDAVTLTAEALLIKDKEDNEKIGQYGADWIRQRCPTSSRLRILTHCNTGSLATTSYGTALGVVRSLHEASVLEQTYFTFTAPYNQGARLTAFELNHDRIPSTLITDSMASACIKLNNIDAIVVGADRVARNGDTANKIGTYQLAITARYHNIPFIVAAPRSSIDSDTETGSGIVIEYRNAAEMTYVTGQTIKGGESLQVTVVAPRTDCWNPSFDVTPAELITAIVTETGVVEANAFYPYYNFIDSLRS